MAITKELQDGLQLITQGKEEGFNILYSHTYNYVYKKAKFIMKNEEDALDLTQETYIHAYRSIGSLEDADNLYAWLGGIVYRQGMKILRKKRELLVNEESECIFENVVSEDADFRPEDAAQAKATSEIVMGMIEKLPELQRSAILAFYYDNMKIDDIAKIFECSSNTVKSRLNYAKKFLKSKVEEHEKQNRYKLCSLSPAIILLAFKSLFATEAYTMSKKTAQTVYNASCGTMGLTPSAVAVVASVEAQASSVATTTAVGTQTSTAAAVTKDATCSETGETTYTCDCGDTYKEDIAMISHTESDWIVVTEVVGATNGLQHTVCTVCGEELSVEEIYPEVVASGAFEGTDITWKIIGTTLYVDGEGAIPGFDESGPWFTRCGNGYGNRYIKAWEMYYEVVDEIVLSEGITAIGKNNFAGFSKVTGLAFPSTLTSIGKYALNGMGLTFLDITENITEIGFNAFGGLNNLTYVYIPGHIKTIPGSCFSGCYNLSKIVLGEGVTEIEENAFCILAWYDLDGVRHGGSPGFEIYVPKSVTKIGDYAFATGDSYGPITVYGKSGSYIEKWVKEVNVQSEVTFVAQ